MATSSAQEIGRLVRKAREKADLTLRELAALCARLGAPMSAPTLMRIERGTARVRVEQLEVIGRALGVDARKFQQTARAA